MSSRAAAAVAAGQGGFAATALSDKSDEHLRVLYLLRMCSNKVRVSDVSVWQLGTAAGAVRFEKRTRGMESLPAWLPARRLGGENAIEQVQQRGLVITPSVDGSAANGLTLLNGELDLDPNDGAAQRFLLCQVGVGKAYVVDDPSELSAVPEGYDSMYLALGSSGDPGIQESGTKYRHEYTVFDAAQVLPMYLVQFFVDDSAGGLDGDFGAGGFDRAEDFAMFGNGGAGSLERLYDRCDFFDPILYVPVSVRDKMVGSHSTGPLAQHRLIGIGDAYESAVAESMKVDAAVASRQEELRSQLRAVDDKLREVNRNAAAVEERIYKQLQDALFQLQDITQAKMSRLLSEEVELRRQLQHIEFMESFLDAQRECASQVEFLHSWKCHVQLRGDAVRFPVRTPSVLQGVQADLDLAGSVQVLSKAAIVQQQQQQMQLQQVRMQQKQQIPQNQRESEDEEGEQVEEPAENAMRNRPVPRPLDLSQGTPQGTPQASGKESLRKLLSQFSTSTDSLASGKFQPSFPTDTPTSDITRGNEEGKDERVKMGTSPVSRAPPAPEAKEHLTIMSKKTPAKYAAYSLKAEAVRRLRQLKTSDEDSLQMAEEAFKDSKLLGHPDVTKERAKIQAEKAAKEEEGDESEDEVKGKAPPPPKAPKVFCDAQALLLALPLHPRSINSPASTELLYATWKTPSKKTLADVFAALPKDEDKSPDRRVKTVVVVKANGRVFGGFADEGWRVDGHTSGRDQCFLFSTALDIKLPFHGRKTLEPPPSLDMPHDSDDFEDGADMEERREFGVIRGAKDVMQFGVHDLIIGERLAGSSKTEGSFGMGLKPGSNETLELLAGQHNFTVDELELWAINSD